MRFIKIGNSYAINADRILDVSYTRQAYQDVEGDEWGESVRAKVTIRIAGAAEVEERMLEGQDAESFWRNLVGGSGE